MTLLVGSIFHMTRKIVSEMTYNVSMGTLNPTIPYHTIIVPTYYLQNYVINVNGNNGLSLEQTDVWKCWKMISND